MGLGLSIDFDLVAVGCCSGLVSGEVLVAAALMGAGLGLGVKVSLLS